VGLLLALAPLLLFGTAGPADLQTTGLQALDRADYQQAEEIFSKLVAADPKDYASFFNLALAEAALKKDPQAIDNFRRAIDLKPGLYQAQLNLGMLYLRNSRPADALPLFQSAVQAKPDVVKNRFYLAESLRSTSKYSEALNEYGQVLEKDPQNARAELGVAECLLSQGKLDESKPHFDKAVSLDASLKSYLLEFAAALVAAHRESDAAPILQQFPDDPGAREKLGQIYLAAHQPDKAAAEFNAAVRLSPTPANRLALATAYLQNHQGDRAEPLLKEALAADPNDVELRLTIGRVYRDQKNYSQAADYFFSATRLKPDSAEAWSELAGVLTISQQYSQALAALDQLHQLNAEKPGHFFLRAIILDKMHQLKPALANYERFLELSGGQNPDQEFQARGRIKALEHEINKR
jgi:tetratricopeptide (TPR) repeat protein